MPATLAPFLTCSSKCDEKLNGPGIADSGFRVGKLFWLATSCLTSMLARQSCLPASLVSAAADARRVRRTKLGWTNCSSKPPWKRLCRCISRRVLSETAVSKASRFLAEHATLEWVSVQNLRHHVAPSYTAAREVFRSHFDGKVNGGDSLQPRSIRAWAWRWRQRWGVNLRRLCLKPHVDADAALAKAQNCPEKVTLAVLRVVF